MRICLAMILAVMVCAGCASSSNEITAQYISPLQYQNLTCEQIGAEAQRVSARAAQVAGVQDQKATNDAWATGIGIVVFWPTLFFVKGDGPTAAELGRLRGEFEALERVGIQKNCGLQFRNGQPSRPITTASTGD